MDTELIEQVRQCVYRFGLDEAVSRYGEALSQGDGIPAAVWLRVSSGGQDEVNQLPEVLTHIMDKNYHITKWYIIHAKSAFYGEQEKAIQEMLHDLRKREFQVLVFWHNDRLERRGTEALFDDLARIRKAGGRFESVLEPYLGQSNMEGSVLTAIAGATSHQRSVHQSEQIRIAVDRVRGNKALWGILPWGYETIGEKYNRTGRPTEEGKRYIPEMFQRIADGESVAQIAAWLREGPLPKITPRTVQRMIRNRTYMGERLDNEGHIIMLVPPLIDANLWKRANDRLASAPRGRRGPASGKPALLTSKLFCMRCRAPMYRVHVHTHFYYYRCHGYLPETKGCGNMVRLERTDWFVTQLLSQAQDDWTELRHIPGENYDDDIARIHLRLNDLPKQGLSDEEEDAERKRLRAERDRLVELNKHARPDRWDDVPICAACDGEYVAACETAGHRKVTVGEHFSSLDYDGQREMILKEVKIYAQSIPDPEIRKISPGPMIRIESRLFKLPVEWINA
jgi:DNA invertase Pin-like site-specific DNA recombinase